MPTTIFRLVLLVLILVLSPVTANRRILHQPFFPQTSSPPPAPPAPPALPFSGDQDPFFPSYPPPPPSPTPLPPSPFASFPANISSLPLPHSPSSHPLSKKLVAVTVCVSISAVFIASVALFFYFRGRRTRPTDIPTPKAAAAASAAAANRPPPPPPPPVLRNSVQSNSTEFLYLGTLANSTSTSSGVTRVPGGVRGSSRPRSRRTDSPELHPLPPLTRRQIGGPDDDQDQFYSPRGSVSGRESGSDSRRVFGSVTQTVDNNGGNCDGDDTTSYSSSSGSDSPSRSVSISISPPISASPKNRSTISISNPKSSPEFIELNLQPPSSPPYLPESDTSSESEKAVEVEAEESPLLSHASSSSRMNSPPQSPILSPIAGKIGQFSPEKSDWNDLNRLSPVSNSSSWSRKSSFLSLNLPAFLGGGKRKSSPENSPTSPISSLGSSLNAPLPRPPPPPPPPPPAFRRSQSPPRPPPLAPLVSKRDGVVAPLKNVLVEKQVADGSRSGESEETTPRPKLKPLHWDKVKASSDREMVWDQLRSSSFK